MSEVVDPWANWCPLEDESIPAELHPHELSTLHVLADAWKERHGCYYGHIREKTGLSYDEVGRALGRLKIRGFAEHSCGHGGGFWLGGGTVQSITRAGHEYLRELEGISA